MSIAVPDLETARAHLEARLGLLATVTPDAPKRHSRVYLHRSYLEVAADPTAEGWRATLFFLRFSNPETLTAHLTAAGVPFRFDEYVGVDGRWDDVNIATAGEPLPILVRRTHPPAVAADWPPPLRRRQPGGARSLAAVYLGVAKWDATLDLYRRLLPGRGTETDDDDRRFATFTLAFGRIELREAETSSIEGVMLAVSCRDVASSSTPTVGDPGASRVEWVDTFGLKLGFSRESEATSSER